MSGAVRSNSAQSLAPAAAPMGRRSYAGSLSRQLQVLQKQTADAGSSSGLPGVLVATAPPYRVSSENPDNSAGLNAFFSDVAASNCTGYLPVGAYGIQAPLVVTGNTSSGKGNCMTLVGAGAQEAGSPTLPSSSGTQIYWNTTSAAHPLFTLTGISKLSATGIGFFGGGKTQDIIYCTQGGQYAPFGWRLTDCAFDGSSNGYGCWTNGGTTACARFVYESCFFNGFGTASCLGFNSNGNSNSLDHSFTGCTFVNCEYGLYLQGSADFKACEFSGNSGADIYCSGNGSHLNLSKCFTQNSNRFILGASIGATWGPVILTGCQLSSFPWSYYYQGGTATPPPNTPDSNAIIIWNRPAGISLDQCVLFNPLTGTGSTIIPSVQNDDYSAADCVGWFNRGSQSYGNGTYQAVPAYGSDTNPVTWIV